MSKLKLTEWFPETIKPVHEGVYQVYRTWWCVQYAMWANGEWSWADSIKSGPFSFTKDSRKHQAKDWRGVSKK